MRFIVMHKVDEKMETGAPPDQKIIEQTGALIGESLKRGVFVSGASLRPRANRTRLAPDGRAWHEQHGPYAGENELVASFCRARRIDVGRARTRAPVRGVEP